MCHMQKLGSRVMRSIAHNMGLIANAIALRMRQGGLLGLAGVGHEHIAKIGQDAKAIGKKNTDATGLSEISITSNQ